MNFTLLNLTITSPFSSKAYPHSIPTTGIVFHSGTRHHRLPPPRRFCDFGFAGNSELSPPIKRRRFTPMATSMELPLLPFSPNEVLVPSESKTLHLYEARYLALLEEDFLTLGSPRDSLLLNDRPLTIINEKSKLFVHFVLDPIIVDDSSSEPSFAARYGCLVSIENVKRLEVGALVSIRGVGRTKIVKFIQADPYLKGIVVPEQDTVPEILSRLSSKITEVKEALHSLNSLEIKLKAPKEALLQTHTANSLAWAEKEPSLDCDSAFIPSLFERVSFAGFQPVSGSAESELLKLQSKKLRAMELKDTLKRLDELLEINRENISIVAAKLAIQSLEMQ